MNRALSCLLCVLAICLGARAAAAQATSPATSPSTRPVPTQGSYTVRLDKPAQVIWGLGFEIQSDSIGSDNLGLPDKVVAVPNNLTPAERERFYGEMLKGFRYCRLALGLYLRGLDPEQKRMIERYPGQMKDLLEMQTRAGFEGYSVEYWSPAPHWKSNGRLDGKDGTLKSTDLDFLSEFADALVDDVRYLESHGLKVLQWSLQNEPPVGHGKYPTCRYTPESYLATFKVVAPRIRQEFPSVLIHATSWDGSGGKFGSVLQADPEAVKYVDAWTWHRVGASSNEQIDKRQMFLTNTHGRPVFNNEFEYLDNKTSDDRFVNTAQSIMNWFVFVDAPTWFWLHALKPSYNAEAKGYSLGFWRPADDTDYTRNAHLKPGHWDYNPQNFNAIAGFLKHMPWDSRRINVDEQTVLHNNRILALRTPAGKLVLVLSNRNPQPFTFQINTALNTTFHGHRYTPSARDLPVAPQTGPRISLTLPPRTVEFWVEQ